MGKTVFSGFSKLRFKIANFEPSLWGRNLPLDMFRDRVQMGFRSFWAWKYENCNILGHHTQLLDCSVNETERNVM